MRGCSKEKLSEIAFLANSRMIEVWALRMHWSELLMHWSELFDMQVIALR